VPVDYNRQVDLPIPPYILGLLLGDGCLAYGVNLTSADEELGDEFIRYADSIGCSVHVTENDAGVPSYNLKLARGAYNPLILTLERLGLFGLLAESKFVPQDYLVASRDQRLQLMAGLMDSDGYLSNCGFDYVTKSRELADDIAQLSRSLGFRVSVNEKYCSCQTGAGGWYFRLSISGDMNVVPCRRRRHTKQQQPRRQKKNVLRTGFALEELPEDDFYGFSLDGNHLYVDGNFFVHHNTGKSLVIAQIATDAVKNWGGRVLLLAHVKELLEQNAEKVRLLCPDIKVGLYSAGLGCRDTDDSIIVAGIQSVYKKACELGRFDLVITDECHRLSTTGEGTYRTFLQDAKVINPNIRVIGLTATPFRLKGGLICKPENILNHVCYEVGIKEMIVNGYLSPLKTRAGKSKVDLSGLQTRAGEFISSQAEEAMDTDWLTRNACKEIAELTENRNSVLIFTTSVAHCEHVAAEITKLTGTECGIVTGNTPATERAELLTRFKGEEVPADLFGNLKPPLKYLANVNVLTTGFDATNIDCVVLLRPTASAGLLIQAVGRGTRLHPGKKDCLILDFGGNILRHGPIDAIQIKEQSTGSGEAPAKECPDCNSLIHAAYRNCPNCGYEFPEPERNNIDTKADTSSILSGEIEDNTYQVKDIFYYVHTKRGADEDAPKTMRIEYEIGICNSASEWVCPEHTGWARGKFEDWWKERSYSAAPRTALEAVELAQNGALAEAKEITVRSVSGEKFDKIIDHTLGEIPACREPGWKDNEVLEPAGVFDNDDDWIDDLPF
jgi:DNA repair protein RadD